MPKRSKSNPKQHWTDRQIREFLNAEAFAEARGTPFTAHMTMHWTCDPSFRVEDWSRRLQRFLDKFQRWLSRNTVPTSFAWMNEVGDEYGPHTHFLLHLPKPRNTDPGSYQRLKLSLEAFVIGTEDLAPDKTDKRGRPWLPVRITPDREDSYGMWSRPMRSGACRYWLKGLDPSDVAYTPEGAESLAAALGIRPRLNALPLPLGVQRFGASRTIGPKARREAGFPELRGLDALRARLNPS